MKQSKSISSNTSFKILNGPKSCKRNKRWQVQIKGATSDLGARTFLRWHILSCKKWDKYKL